MTRDAQQVYVAIARNLQQFGYPEVTPAMIRETDEAMASGTDLPHGVISMFAKKQLTEAREHDVII
jgi:hypothetical protein